MNQIKQIAAFAGMSLVMAFMCMPTAMAQGGPGGRGGQGGPGGPGFNIDPSAIFDRMDSDGDGSISKEEFTAMSNRMRNGGRNRGDERRPQEGDRQRGADALQERLGVSDEEWEVLEPRIQNVNEKRREAMMSMMRMGPRPGGQASAGDEDAEAKALNTVIEDEEASADQIKKALEAYRAAKTEATEALAEARDELRELVTVRQEAILVMVGILD